MSSGTLFQPGWKPLAAVVLLLLGPLVVFVHVSGALPVRVECEVLLANVYEALVAGTEWLETTTLRNDVVISGTTITVRKQDGSSTQYTKTGTFASGADVLTGLD